MNRKEFSVATYNLFNFQEPGKAMNPGQKKWTEDELTRPGESGDRSR